MYKNQNLRIFDVCIYFRSLLIIFAVTTANLFNVNPFAPYVAMAATTPLSGAASKPAGFTITPPWSNNVEHRVVNGYNDGGAAGHHKNINTSCCPNDYYALDFNLTFEEAVYPVASGTIHYAGPATGGWSKYGNIIVVDHQSGFRSLYAHLNSIAISTGQSVDVGTRIGGAGGSGGWLVHLHFALYLDSKFQNTSAGIGPYGGQAVVPEPFANCTKNSSQNCENLVEGDRLRKSSRSALPPPPLGSACPGPDLNNPGDGATVNSQTVSFSWNPPSGCTFSGYTFRIKNVSDMDSGGTTIRDTGEGGIQRTETITGWDNTDLYWGVRAANAAKQVPRDVFHVWARCPRGRPGRGRHGFGARLGIRSPTKSRAHLRLAA